MIQIFRRSIKARFIIMTIGILLSVVFVLTLVTALTSAGLLKEESERQLSQSLSQSIEMLSGFMNTREINLDIWSSNPLVNAIFDDPALAMVFVPSLREYFSKIREKEPWISNIFLIQEDELVYDDSDGFEFYYESDGTPDGMKNLLSLPDNGISVTNLNQFNLKLNKNVILIKRNIVKNGSAAKKNFIVLILDIETMNNRLFGNIRIGRRGFAVMAAKNTSGQIVVSTSTGEGIEKESFSKAASQWKKFSDIPDSSPFILIRKQILPSYALAVLGIASINDIREPVIYLIYLSVIFSILASGIGIWSAVFFSGKLISPIFKLIHTIELISKGDLTQRVDVSRQDEIGVLASAFNEMTAQLMKYQNHLEEMVEKRTAELTTANEKLKTEIEERIHAEKALRESEQKLYNIIEFLPDAIIVIDKEGKVIAWNKAVENMTRIKAEDMLGKGNHEHSVPFYGERRPILIDLAMVPNDEFEKKYPQITKHGSVINGESFTPNLPGGGAYLFATASALYDSDGNVTGSIELIRDITDRKKAEDAVKEALTEAQNAREAAEEANRKITESISYAKMIQRSLLANLDVVKAYLPESFFIWEPRDIVGGDIFYTESFEDGFIVAVIDCTGHGVPGAFMTMIAISALKRIVKDEGCHDPAEILKRLNFIVKTTLHQDKEYAVSDDGMDVGVCFVNRKSSEVLLTFAGAKISLYSVHNSEVRVIKGNRENIGYKRSDVNFDFTNHTVIIEKSMKFYIATDGFADQMGGEDGRRFGTESLKNLLKEISGEPFEKQRNMLVHAFENYRGEHERQDDMTVVGFGF